MKRNACHRNRWLNGTRILIRAVLLLGLTVPAASAFAADIYVKIGGTRSSGTSTAGDWTNANCYPNPIAGFPAMSAGDVMIIDDGDYNGAGAGADSWMFQYGNLPPNGTGKDNMTVIRARHIPCQEGYSCSSPLKVTFGQEGNQNSGLDIEGPGAGTKQYIKFWGIRFRQAMTYTGWDHLYFKECAFQGTLSGNTAALSIDGKYNLIEDCVFYGMGRYKFLIYDDSRATTPMYNVCRRCVARQDYANKNNEATMPIATFNSYETSHSAYLNSIAIDGDSPGFWQAVPTEFGGAFYATETSTNVVNKGSIAINTAMSGIGYGWNSNPVVNTVTDFAAVKTAGGIGLGYGSVNRATLYDIGTDNFTYRSGQIGQITFTNDGLDPWGVTNPSISTNLVMKNLQGVGIGNSYGNIAADYVNLFGAQAGGTTPSDLVTTDPSQNGLLYPVRIEAGSPLSTAGSGGGQMGANILKRIGHDGDFWGDAGWDQEQAANLWPWPYEDWVKAELASMPATINGQAMPSPTRGVASPTAKGLDGVSPLTLTRYIWESLGNPIPSSIYGTTTADTAPPTVTSFGLPATSSSPTVAVSSFSATDNVRVTGYLITESSTAPLAAASGWSSSAPAGFTFSGSGTRTAYAWAKDAAGNVSASVPATVTIAADITPPSVSITSPSASASVSGTVTVSTSSSDNVGVNKVELYVDNVIYALDGSAPYSFSWSTSSYANGSHQLLAKAYDAAGNFSQSSPVAVTVNNPVSDTTRPAVTTFTMPSSYGSLAVPVSTFTASDNVGVTGYLITESGTAPAPTASGWTAAAPTSFTFSGSGTRTAYAWAKDAAGNVSAGVSQTVTISVTTYGTTYYLSPTGSDANSCSASAPCKTLAKPVSLAVAGDTILLADGTYPGFTIDGTSYPNFVGTAAAPITIKAQGSNAVISGRDSSVTRGNLYLTNTSYIVVDGLKSSGATGSLGTGIAVRFCDHVTVKNGTFFNNSWVNIFTSHVSALVLDNNTTYGAIGQHGIYVANATASHDQPVIRNNKTYGNTLNGIHINGDGGYFTGAVIENNRSYNNGASGINMDGIRDSMVRNNLIYANHGSGITMYQIDATAGPSNLQVYHNTVDMASDGRWCIRINNTAGPITLENNILYSRNSATGSISTTTATDLANLVSDYNALISAGSYVATPNDESTYYTFAQWQGKGKDLHSINPSVGSLFVSLGSDYHLASSSPAIDRGIVLASVTSDLAGAPRPQGTSSDIGAYESSSSAPALPVVATFVIPATSSSTSIPVTQFTAGTSVPVTGYLITESATTPAASASGWTSTPPASFTVAGAGSHTLYAWVKDASGNVSAPLSATTSVTLPVAAPTVAITSPAAGTFLKGAVTVLVSASSSAGIAKVELYVNGVLLSTDSAAPYKFAWKSGNYPQGNNVLQAKAYDKNGNSALSAPVTVVVDRTAPTVTISSPAAKSTVGASTVIKASALDNVGGSGVARMDLYIDGTLITSVPGNVLNWTWNTTSYASGSHVILVRGIDKLGNTGGKSISVIKP